MDGRQPGSPAARAMLALVLLTGAVYSGLIFVVVGPILPALAQHFGYSRGGDVLAQWVMTAPAVGLVIGGLVGGWLLKRASPTKLLPALLLVYGLCGVSGAIIEAPAVLLASRLVIGFCAVLLSLGTTVLIAEHYEEATRARMLGYKNAISAGTGIFAMLVAGQVADAFGWRAAFLLYAVALLFVVPTAVSLGRHRRPPAPAESDARLLPTLAGNWPIYVGTVLFGVLVMAPMTQLPFLLREIGVDSARTLSLILGCSSLGSALGAFVYGRIFARCGPRGTLVLNMATWTAGMVTLGLTGSPGQAAIGCLICGASGGIFVVHMANLLVGRVRPAERGGAVGLLYVALFAGDFLTPLLLVPLAGAFGRHATFLLLAVPCAITLAGTVLLMQRGRRAIAAA